VLRLTGLGETDYGCIPFHLVLWFTTCLNIVQQRSKGTMPRERSRSVDSTSNEDGYVVIRPHSPPLSDQSGGDPSAQVPGKSQSLPFTGESTLPADSTALSAITKNSKPSDDTRQKPVLHAAICKFGLANPSAVYTYTYQGEGTFPHLTGSADGPCWSLRGIMQDRAGGTI
jgi:hypothetical protein